MSRDLNNKYLRPVLAMRKKKNLLTTSELPSDVKFEAPATNRVPKLTLNVLSGRRKFKKV
jgi:hypothetical protein